MAKEVQFELNTVTAKFERNMAGALKTARQFDSTMAKLQKTSEVVEKTLKRINGDIDVKVGVDVGAVDRAETKIDALDNTDPVVNIKTDVSALDRAESQIDALDNTDPVVNVKTDVSAVDRAESQIDALDSNDPKVTVRAEEDGLSDIKRQLDNIQTMGVISVAIQVGGMAKNAFDSVPVVSNIQDQQQSLNILKASQGDIESGAQAISTAWTNNWGQSKTEIAEVVAELQKLKVPTDELDDATLSVFELTAGGRDLTETFRAQKVLVSTGVAGSFREAADLIAAGLTTAVGTSDDFLETLIEYAPQLREIGISGEQFLGFLNEGVIEGAWNTDKLADSLKEMNVRITEAVTDPATPYAQALTRIDQMDEAQAYASGELSGEEFIAGVIAAAQEQGSNFDLFEIFGSGAEDLGATVLQNIDWTALEEFEIPEGAASAWSDTLRDNAGNDWTSLTRTISDGFLSHLDVMTGGFDVWVGDVRKKMQTLTTELQNGTALPEALEIVLEAPGLAAQIRNFEAAIGDFIIEFQLIVANILDGFGYDDAAGTIRSAAADQSANQLEYKLQFGDVEAAGANIQEAIDRGVDASKISEILTEVGTTLTSEGNFTKAQGLIDSLTALQSPGTVQVGLEYTGPTSLLNAFDPAYKAVITVEIPPGTPNPQAYALEHVYADPAYLQTIKENNGFIQDTIIGGGAMIDPVNAISTQGLQTVVDDATLDAEELSAAWLGFTEKLSGLGDLVQATRVVGYEKRKPGQEREHRNPINETFLAFESTLGDFNSEAPVFIDRVLLPFESGFADVSTAITDVANAATTLPAQIDPLTTSLDGATVAADAVGLAGAAAVANIRAATEEDMPAAIKYWRDYQQAAFDGITAAGGIIPNIDYAPPGANGGTGQARAKGGPVTAGEMYTVGEQGPELFVPGMSGAIIPHELSRALMSIPSMAGGGGGGVSNSFTTVNANININPQGTAQLMGGASRVARALRRGN